jgi:hypothetical protein
MLMLWTNTVQLKLMPTTWQNLNALVAILKVEMEANKFILMFYLTQYIRDIIISACNQYKNY